MLDHTQSDIYIKGSVIIHNNNQINYIIKSNNITEHNKVEYSSIMSSSRKYYPGELSSDESDGDTEIQGQQLENVDLKNSDHNNEESQRMHSPQRVLDYVNGYDDYESDTKDALTLPLETEKVSEASNNSIKPSIILTNDTDKNSDLSTPNLNNKSTNNKFQSPTTSLISTDHLQKSLDQLADDFTNYLSQGESDDNDEDDDKDDDKTEEQITNESGNSNINIISQFEKNKQALESSLYPDDTAKRNNRLSKIEPPKKAFAPGLASASESVSSPLNDKNQDSPVYSNPMTPIDQLNTQQEIQQPSYFASTTGDNKSILSDHTDVTSNKTLKPNGYKEIVDNTSVDNSEHTAIVTGYSSSQPNSIVQTPEILNEKDFNNHLHPPSQLDEDPDSDNAWKPEDDEQFDDNDDHEADAGEVEVESTPALYTKSAALEKDFDEVEAMIKDHLEQDDTTQKTDDDKEWKTDEELNGGHIVDDYYNTGSSDNEKDINIGNDVSHDHESETLENIKEAGVDQSFQMGDDNEGDITHGNDGDEDEEDDDENAWKPQSENNGLHRYESSGSLSTGKVSLNSSVKHGYEPSIQTTTTSSRVNTSSLATPSKKSISTESEEDEDDEKIDDDNVDADADDVWKPDAEPDAVHSDLESTENAYNDDAISEDAFDPEYPIGLADGFRDKFIRSNSRHTVKTVASSMHPGGLTRDNSVYTSSGSTLQGTPINAPGFQAMKNSPMPPIPTSQLALNNSRIPSNATAKSYGTLGSNSTLTQSTVGGDSYSTASSSAGSAIRSNTNGSPLQAASSANSSSTTPRIPTGYTYKSMIPSDIPADLGKKKKNSMVSAASVMNSNSSSPLSNNHSDDRDLKDVKSEDSQFSSNSKQRVTSLQSSTSSNDANNSSSMAANTTEQSSSASENTNLASGVMPSADIKGIMAINDAEKRIEELRKKRNEFKNYDSGLSKLLKEITLNGTGVTDRYKDSSIGPNVSKAYQTQVTTTDINIDLERTKSKIKKTSRRFLGRFHGLNKNN